MLENCFLSHRGPDGLKPYMHCSLAGRYQANAENLHGVIFCSGRYPVVELADAIRDAMDDLMSSPGHRDNALDPHNAQGQYRSGV